MIEQGVTELSIRIKYVRRFWFDIDESFVRVEMKGPAVSYLFPSRNVDVESLARMDDLLELVDKADEEERYLLSLSTERGYRVQ